MAFLPSIKKRLIINVLVVLRQVVGLMQFIIFRHIFVLKGFLLLMSWDSVASLNFPVETSTDSFSPCSGILLAGSEIGKSEGIELSMGFTVTIKDMTTLEELILINTIHQCQSGLTSPSKLDHQQSVNFTLCAEIQLLSITEYDNSSLGFASYCVVPLLTCL